MHIYIHTYIPLIHNPLLCRCTHIGIFNGPRPCYLEAYKEPAQFDSLLAMNEGLIVLTPDENLEVCAKTVPRSDTNLFSIRDSKGLEVSMYT